MILDRQNQFSIKQALTVTAVSTDTVYFGPVSFAGNSNGGHAMPIYLGVAQSFVSAGATTLDVEVQSATDAAFTTPIGHGKITLTKAQLQTPGRLPHSLTVPIDVKPYVRLSYTVNTGPFTAGQINAGLTTGRQTNL